MLEGLLSTVDIIIYVLLDSSHFRTCLYFVSVQLYLFRRAHLETAARVEKGAAIKELDDRVVGLRREIGKGKDTLAEFITFQTFLYSLSPEHWRLQQEERRSNGMQ